MKVLQIKIDFDNGRYLLIKNPSNIEMEINRIIATLKECKVISTDKKIEIWM
jgi:hypothetical protein